MGALKRLHAEVEVGDVSPEKLRRLMEWRDSTGRQAITRTLEAWPEARPIINKLRALAGPRTV